jgi:hypothetical protein
MQPENPIAAKYANLALSLSNFSQPSKPTLSQLLDQLGLMCLSSIIAHQAIHLLFYPKQTKESFFRVYNLGATVRPTEHTVTVFGLKLLMDFGSQGLGWENNQYKIGGLAGLLGYLIGRPIDQLDAAKR